MIKGNIFIGTHKDVEIPRRAKEFSVIKMGNNSHNLLIEGYTDDTLKNISFKNPNYSELTAEYWISKNVHSDILGFQHYRRYFVDAFNRILDENSITKILKDYDAILPSPRIFMRETVENYYEIHHRVCDLKTTREVVLDLHPEYIKDFDYAMSCHRSFQYNMIIAKKSVYNDYHDWLFSILFELEKRIDIRDLDQYQSRIFGFISERLLAVWMLHNNVNYTTRFVKNIEQSYFQNEKEKYLNMVKEIFTKSRIHS
ncbi:DUF4422 domain-containing protein [Leuconostoc mesenteroides]|uniref:DUF4422 domain-containing protein n=1 Tax=Leuconostoc mesenteroides TaxID=1245 RepID=UPI0032DFB34F